MAALQNTVYMLHMLAAAFPESGSLWVSVSQATAIGAAFSNSCGLEHTTHPRRYGGTGTLYGNTISNIFPLNRIRYVVSKKNFVSFFMDMRILRISTQIKDRILWQTKQKTETCAITTLVTTFQGRDGFWRRKKNWYTIEWSNSYNTGGPVIMRNPNPGCAKILPQPAPWCIISR